MFDFYIVPSWGGKKGIDPYIGEYIKGYMINILHVDHFIVTGGRNDGKEVIIDNGAWTRHNRGEHKDPYEVAIEMESLHFDNNPIIGRVLPDVVGDWKKTYEYYLELKDIVSGEWLVCIQDGFKIEQVVEIAKNHRLFIGGSSWSFKQYAIETLWREKIGNLHVGRVSAMSHLRFCWHHPAVVSIDNSTFSRYGMRRGDKTRIEVAAERLKSSHFNTRTMWI